jgi:hypothetical protein
MQDVSSGRQLDQRLLIRCYSNVVKGFFSGDMDGRFTPPQKKKMNEESSEECCLFPLFRNGGPQSSSMYYWSSCVVTFNRKIQWH